MDADKAIDRLINHHDLSIVQEWRGKHLSPMIKLKDFVVEKMQESQIDCEFVSARLKMITTILDKVKTGRHKKVSTMQDLGGVRVVFHNQEDLYKLHTILLECKTFKIVRTKDYIKEPKETGYRGIHIIYNVDGYSIELQLRTIGQHIWATTVETVGWYLKQDLKSGKGNSAYLKYFQQLSLNVSEEVLAFLIFKREYRYKEIYNTSITRDNKSLHIMGDSLSHDKNTVYGKNPRFGHYIFIYGIRPYISSRGDFALKYMECFKDPIYAHQNYKFSEIKSYNQDGWKKLLVWLSDTSKLEEAYPCFFSQTKQFTDYLEKM